MNVNASICGAELISYDDLQTIPTPEATNRWTPLAHSDMVDMVLEQASAILPYPLHDMQLGITKDGERFFGVLRFMGDAPSMGLAVGLRNTHDKTFSASMAVGGSVFVCSNMMMTGEIYGVQRHTGDILRALRVVTVGALTMASEDYKSMVDLKGHMMNHPVDTVEGYRMLGELFGEGVITPTMNNIAYREWREPTHSEFGRGDLWSLYNCCTEAAKKAPIKDVLEVHSDLTRRFGALVA